MSQQSSHRPNLGKYGESLAAEYLEKHGYRIIEQNFKARYGEIDIISQKDRILVFIEVKTRIGKKYGLPEEAVTKRKIREVVITAEYYSLLHPNTPKSHRIDVIAIELFTDRTIKDLRHIENITQ
jgi:putative endonuclease